jgi:hypothetical protein
MVLQVEDCIDCLKVLYPEIKFILLLDHSCGHDRQREDGLNVKKMTKSFGGKQGKLRDTVIKQQQGYLGPHDPKLKVGDAQHMIFQPTDEGPFWMTPEEREKRRHDVRVQGKKKKRKYDKEELLNMLKEKGLTVKGKVKALQQAATANGIPIEEELEVIIEGWEGKAKGLLQVLWERGWIDTSIRKYTKYYTLNGTKNRFGNVQNETSLKHLMASCSNFEEEESMLKHIGRLLGVEVDRTPKCHCELAGEGIEYAWGCAKNYYRRLLLEQKQGKEKFLESVRESISRNVVTRERAQKFARRARWYILGYHALWSQGNSDRSELDSEENSLAIMPAKLEQMVQKFKTHRCAMNFDHSFCNVVFSETP